MGGSDFGVVPYFSHENVFEERGRVPYAGMRLQFEPIGMQMFRKVADVLRCQTCGQEEGV